jgi:hypothetical protein
VGRFLVGGDAGQTPHPAATRRKYRELVATYPDSPIDACNRLWLLCVGGWMGRPPRNGKEQTMKTYYVATLARYVLVEAEDESQARELGQTALHDLYADLRERLGRDVPIEIRTVREAAQDEIELWNWHHEMLAKEKRQ